MDALMFLIRKSMKNKFMELLHKPGKLVLYVLAIAAIIGFALLSLLTKARVDTPTPVFWLTLIVFAYVSLFVFTSISRSLSGGDAIFDMNDVNLLFVSPVSSRKILLYGISHMVKTAFFASFFLLFQSSSLAIFGVGFDGVLLIFAGVLLSMMVLMEASLVIYSVTNGRSDRKRIVKGVMALLFLPLIGFVVYQYFHTGDMYTVLELAAHSIWLFIIPVAGWTAGGVTAFLSGDAPGGVLLLGLNLLTGVGLTVYVLLSHPDYYEDVLVATETAFEKKRAVTEGNYNAAASSAKKVYVSKTGISGRGASALFGKHMRENFRENRFGFITPISVFFIVASAAASFFIRDLLLALQILMWIQIFLIGTGRGLKETYAHYVYLIPASSFEKIIWGNLETVARVLVESVLIFGISGLLIKASFLHILPCMLAYTLFSFLLLGVNYLSMRFVGADVSIGILLVIYCFAVILIMVPGIILAVVAGSVIGGDIGYMVGLLVLAAWELAVGLGCFAMAKGVLHNCDMVTVKPGK